MGSQKQPFLYYAGFQDDRLPAPLFDPKAVTRASWEPKPERRKQNGPLISLDRHQEWVCFRDTPSGLFDTVATYHDTYPYLCDTFMGLADRCYIYVVMMMISHPIILG
jgi:hypothetical protein